MDKSNHTVTDFILVGFTTDPVMQLILFVVFLAVYSVTLVGNTTLITLICNDSQLHMPMYFFTGNLSFLDLWYSSVYTPKILVTCISEDKSISFGGCVAQFFFSAGLAYSECYLLDHPYDHYVAISKPLLYSQAMSIKLCAFLVAASYLGGFINSSVITRRTFALNFCADNVIDDFCHLLPLVKLACGRKDGYQTLLYFFLASNVIAPLALILASYLFIITTILRIRSTQGRLKAFSTCSSHLISVTLYYGSILHIYCHPPSSYSMDRDKIVSTFYTVVFPMLNPMIYSLRNKDEKEALNELCEVLLAMEKGNHTVTEYILVGFTTDPVMQLILFVVFLSVYSITLVGNTTLMTLICDDSWLHTPTYFFTGNLSFLDFWYPSVYTPKILVTLICEDKSISFAGCVAQFFFSAGLGYSECYLLATMAYDHYVAISNPLLYAQVTSKRLCIYLVIYSYTGGFVNAVILTSNTFTLDFCGDNVFDDFFCDVPPLVKLACDVKESYQAVLYFLMASSVITPPVLILASYLFIIAAILRIRSTQGRLKAFSTCSSHLISVTLYYGSILYIYSRPHSSYSPERDKMVSTFYTVVFPMLNPMIYILRNKDVKEALKKLLKLTQPEV
ncbi:LOW QUALITY PROTEIN: olfactory receptor 9G4-like [Dugong dugon]